MKRFPFVIGATLAGLAGVLSFHSRSTRSPLPTSQASQSRLATTGQGVRPRPSSTTSTTSPARRGPATTAPPSGRRTATGTVEQYGYGELSVRVTVSGTTISDVRVASLQTAESYSQEIANQAIPELRRQVLALQSARIDGLSGATYTSEAYALSVQSALRRLHFK